MKAIVVRKSTYHSRYWVTAEGVRGIHVHYEEDDGQTSLSAATKLANKYGWLQDGKYRLEEGYLPNLDDVFVFVKNKVESESDIRRDLRELLEKYDAQLVAIDYCHQPRNDVIVRFESTKTAPTDVLIELNYSVTDYNAYELSEEAIADD